jgi:hypothetical protein
MSGAVGQGKDARLKIIVVPDSVLRGEGGERFREVIEESQGGRCRSLREADRLRVVNDTDLYRTLTRIARTWPPPIGSFVVCSEHLLTRTFCGWMVERATREILRVLEST